MSIEWKGGGRSLYNCPVYMPDADVPRSLYVPLLQCDACAWELSELDGAPRFRILLVRKAARGDAGGDGEVFRPLGSAFREENPVREVYEFPFSQPKFRLARLGNPATAEDVAAGRAVFSLRDSGQVRVVAVKPFPSNARWKTLKEFRLREPVPIFPPQSPVDLSVERIIALRRIVRPRRPHLAGRGSVDPGSMEALLRIRRQSHHCQGAGRGHRASRRLRGTHQFALTRLR